MSIATAAKTALATVVAAAVLSACTGTRPAPTSDAAPPRDTAVLFQEPLPTAPVDFTVLAATQNVIWASFNAPASMSGDRISLDGGGTWQRGIGQSSITRASGSNGRFGYAATNDELPIPYLMSPTDPAAAKALRWDDDGSRYLAVGVGAALSSNGTLATADSRRTVKFPTLPSGLVSPKHTYSFTGDAALAVRITTTSSGHDYAAMVDARTGKKAGVLTLPRTAQHRVQGSDLYSLSADATGLTLCRQPLPSGEAACRLVVAGDRSGTNPTLYQWGALSVIKDPAGAQPLLVEAGRVTPIALPEGTASWRGEGNGDPTRPLLRTVDAAGEPHHVRVGSDGSTAEWLTVPRVPQTLFSLEVTPTAVLGSWNGANRVWVRAMADGQLQPATWLPGQGVSGASGSRWLIWGGKATRTLYDAGQSVRTVKASSLSGPYLATESGVQHADGRQVSTTQALAQFGSLVAEKAPRSAGTGSRVSIRDLADASAKPTTVRLSKGDLSGNVYLWGDWVGSSDWSDTGDQQAVLRNHRTGATRAHQGALWQLGDGFAVLDLGSELAVWNFGTDDVIKLGTPFAPGAVAAWGDLIVYTTQAVMVVRRVPGVGTSQPRLLGAVTSGDATPESPWTAAIDTTKPLAAGNLTITDSTGLVVRTLPTPAAPDGSLRGLSWDGLDDAGQPLPKGTYTWTLIAFAVDTSGQVVNVTGTDAATGTIKRR